MAEIWISVEGRRYGPYDEGRFFEMLAGGTVAPTADVWSRETQWVKAYQLPRSGAALAASTYAGTPAPLHTYPPPSMAPTPTGTGTNGWAVATLVAGIVALLVSWIPVVNMIAIGLATLAVVLAVPAFVMAGKGAGGKGLAIAGLVLAVLSVVAFFVVNKLFFDAVGETVDRVATQSRQAKEGIRVTFGEVRPGSREATARVVNTNSVAILGGVLTVQAQDATGRVVDQTIVAIPRLAAGESAVIDMTFVDRLPRRARLVVSDLTVLSL